MMGMLLEEKEILKEEKSLLQALNSNVGKMAIAMEKARIDEYTSMLTRPWKFFLMNFIAGVFRGLGMAIGMTLVAALLLFLLAKILGNMIDLPIVGMYISEIVNFVNQYLQKGVPVR